ncbi:hypothetical protein CK216_11455 [Mesorhizobium sp. WSM3876]|nr:hypothetical protein CK216_11455 [Mesorhizobium sp. WSM3876]
MIRLTTIWIMLFTRLETMQWRAETQARAHAGLHDGCRVGGKVVPDEPVVGLHCVVATEGFAIRLGPSLFMKSLC